ncbi:MAG: hypothetical protein NW215_07300 [Hyphomicrobiales bacterium]|nr:hypothetical protein [Hyphomicrobiales bacterium]
MKFRMIVIAAALGGLVGAASAHEVAKGPNGGKVADVSGHHLEFVPTSTEVIIYASDEADKPIATAGSKGRIIIQTVGKTIQVQLVPSEPNKLVGKLDAPLSAGTVAVVSTTFADGHGAQARFTVD